MYGVIRRSASFASTRARVNCEPTSGMSGLWASRYGTAPMWSSWPWVSTIAWTSASRSRIDEKSGRIRSTPGLLDVGEQHSAVDDEQLAVELEDGHVAADRAEPAERDDAQRTGRQRWRTGSGALARGLGHSASAPASSSPAAAQSCAQLARSRRRSRRPAASGPARPAGPRRFSAALTRMTPWVRKMPVEQRQQLAVQAQRLGRRRPARTPRSSALVGRPNRWVDDADHADRADRQQRQGVAVVAGVDRPGRSRRVTQEVATRSPLASLTATIRSCSASRSSVSVAIGSAGAERDVVEHHRQVGRVGDGGEVAQQPGLRRPVVVRRHDQQAVRAGLLGRARQLDRVRGCRWCRRRRRRGPGRRPRRPRRAAGSPSRRRSWSATRRWCR